MVRKLKYHEQKLLRKTDFITYKQDQGHRDKAVVRRYMIQKPEDYHKYNRLCGVRAGPHPPPLSPKPRSPPSPFPPRRPALDPGKETRHVPG